MNVTPPADSFPRQAARTRNFTVGAPRTFTVASDGRRVVFLRSPSGVDAHNGLWVLDVESGWERLVADARTLLARPAWPERRGRPAWPERRGRPAWPERRGRPAWPERRAQGDEDDLPEAERARRERVREVGAGIVAYDTDADGTLAVVAAGGRLFLVDLVGAGGAERLASAPGAFDPRLSPGGDRVAYVAGRSLRVVDRAGADHLVAEEDDPDVSWGSADFVAAEEMHRTRGHWWAPDGRCLAAARVDVGPVLRWHVGDPTEPDEVPVTLRYPAAGTANALVGLSVIDPDGARTPVPWDYEQFPYLVEVRWGTDGLLVAVQSRDQRVLDVLAVDPRTGASTRRLRQTDPMWVDIVPGTPGWLGGRVVTAADRFQLDGQPLSPEGVHVRRVAWLDPDSGRALVIASEDDPTVVDVYRLDISGPDQHAPNDVAVARLTPGDGVHDVLAAGGDVVVISSRGMDRDGPLVQVWKGDAVVATVASYAEAPLVRPEVWFAVVGERRLRTAVVLPSGGPLGAPLPVLMDPYGGPHAQRVLRGRSAFVTSQWLADQGFAVVVIDGRGTPGRGPEWDRAVHGDLAGPVLDDQVDALHALAQADERLDLSRVAIRGWSFGGYLAALAVLRRPDVFHAAIAGAPVTDWALYDTHYTERYLGHPAEAPEAYRRSSIIEDAGRLERPLLLIHGFRDDNVVAAHSMRLSRALVEAGRPHRFLPLPGATHMTRDEAVAENLLRLQVDFLREALGSAVT